jgi:LacI family transcriptional regulator
MSDSSADTDLRARATMHDVAALAGVGLKTVSRVMNGVTTVDPELVRRVRDAAQKLGYRRNLTASNLRRADRRTNTIGLLVEDVSNPFSAAVHRGVEEVSRERGAVVLAGSLNEDPDLERVLARALIDRGVDGLIIAPASDDQRYLVAEQAAGVRVVFIDRTPVPLIADAVVVDNHDGGYRAVTHLLQTGARTIGYLGDELRIRTAADRFAGYRHALADAGLPVPDVCVHALRTVAAAQDAATELLHRASPPTALFASQNLVAVGCVLALHRLGLEHRVPLVGFDDVPLAQALKPGLTVVAQDPIQMGRLAARLLFDQVDGVREPARTHVLPTTLIPRGSGEIAVASASSSPRGG